MDGTNLKENYQKVVKLLTEGCYNDPDDEPYRSKYEAKKILVDMEKLICKKHDETDPKCSDYLTYSAILASVYLQLGIICIETEEPSMGEEYLMKAFNNIPDHLNRKFVICSMNIRNQLGILWSQRSDIKKSQEWLEGSESLYKNFTEKSPPEIPLTTLELFDMNEGETDNVENKELEKIHTLTKFYLAQVYGSSKDANDLLKSAIYCHETLRRQLIYNEYEPVDWALNSATLSQFFMERTLFTQARHHLAAASYILSKYEDSIGKNSETDEEIESKKEEIRHRGADISRCWAKYGIFLLEYSKNKLSDSSTEIESELDNDSLKNLWFNSLNLSLLENEVMASELVLYEDARQTFLFTQKHINKAKDYYTLEHHASDHVQIVQDHSQLFKHLTAFENDEEKQCKMIKRRIDLLQGVLKELNSQYYLHACRQLWFELGESFHDVMHIKYQKVKTSSDMPTPHALKKINFLAEQSILNFNNFIDSVKNKATNELPEELEDDLMKPTLVAHFYLGRLHYKIITQDTFKQAENTKKSYNALKYLVSYCEKNECARKILHEELSVSKEMMSLLEIKMLQI